MIRSVPVRAGTTAEWADADRSPTLRLGELGVDTDAAVIKIGDGTSAFTGLDAALGSGGSGPVFRTVAVGDPIDSELGDPRFNVVTAGLGRLNPAEDGIVTFVLIDGLEVGHEYVMGGM